MASQKISAQPLDAGEKSAAPLPPGKRLAELDVLRAFGILSVVTAHLLEIGGFRAPIPTAIDKAAHLAGGVDLFFAISGFVISGTLASFWASPAGAPVVARYIDFMLRRFWRLWPAMAFWLTVCLLLSAGKGIPFSPGFETTLNLWKMGLVYLSDVSQLIRPTSFGYFWSLSVEWQFYMALPILLIAVRSNPARLQILIALFICCMFYRFGGQNWKFVRFDPIICGVIAYMALRIAKRRVSLPHLSRPLISAFTTAFLLAVILSDGWFGLDAYLSQSVRSIVCGLLVYLAAHDEGLTSSFGLQQKLLWIGERSYSIYLSHIPIMMIVVATGGLIAGQGHIDFETFWPLFFVTGALLVIPVANVSFASLEQCRSTPVFLSKAFARMRIGTGTQRLRESE